MNVVSKCLFTFYWTLLRCKNASRAIKLIKSSLFLHNKFEMADIWFNGPVANAVATVNENNLVFLVFIYGSYYSLVYFSTCTYLSLL